MRLELSREEVRCLAPGSGYPDCRKVHGFQPGISARVDPREGFEVHVDVERDADASTIKRAYRKKARELHPDVSDEPDAEERFRRVTEAYEVLSDEERRATYDRFGEAGLKRGGWEPQFANFGSIADIFSAFFG